MKRRVLIPILALIALVVSYGQPRAQDATSPPVVDEVVVVQPTAPESPAVVDPGAPPSLEELSGMVSQMVRLFKTKTWPALIALGITFLMGLLKTPMLRNLLVQWIPKRYLLLIPIILGVIVGGIQGWIAGGWETAASTILESGGLAILFHEAWDHLIRGKG